MKKNFEPGTMDKTLLPDYHLIQYEGTPPNEHQLEEPVEPAVGEHRPPETHEHHVLQRPQREGRTPQYLEQYVRY